MSYKIRVLSLVLSFFGCAELSAQISGTVIYQASKKPMALVTVSLLNATDSTANTLTVTDPSGRFNFDKIKPGHYTLRFSFIGYRKTDKAIDVAGKKINAGTVEMIMLPKAMNEVTVTAQKSLLNTSIDRKVYNVSQDIMAQSGTASDILKNVPSVEVDIDGNVSLRGSTEVMILINGKPSPLMGKSRAEVLEQLPANAIERIEVISNPSAKFKPDGTSGIINIVLKKNTKAGWNGNVIANAGNRDRYSGAVNLNYKPGKLNLFTGYSWRQDARVRLRDIQRTYFDSAAAIKSYYSENSNSRAHPVSNLITFGADYELNKKNSVGVSGNYRNRDQSKTDAVDKLFYDNNRLLTNAYDRLRDDPEQQVELGGTAYWEHNFPGEDHSIRAEFNASKNHEQEDNHYNNIYRYPTVYSSFDNTLIKQAEQQQQITVDYSRQLSESQKLEAGYDGSFTAQDFNFYGEFLDAATNKFVPDLPKINHFKYNENIHAFYGTYQKSYKRFGYAAGLRFEEAIIKGNQVTKDSAISNNYFKIYPTLHLSYKKGSGEFQLNYSRRVHRPEGDDINPFPEYQDPYNVRAGNPKLLPEIIHSVEFGYKWQNKNFSLVPGIYYRYKQNGFTEITLPLNDSVLLTTQQNLSNDQSAGLEIIASAKVGKFFSANMSNNFFYNRIDASSLGYADSKSIVSMSINLNTTFNITKTTMMQLSSNYRSPRLAPQGKQYGSWVMNGGVRQDFLKKKLSATLTVSDIFQTLKQRSEISSSYLRQYAVSTRDVRIIYLGVSYRFGKIIKKATEEKLQFDNGL